MAIKGIKLKELWSRAIPKKKEGTREVYENGEDNLYPNKVERIITNSPTAKGAVETFAKFIMGKGFENPADDVIVNKKKNYRLSDISRLIAQDIATQGGSFIWVGFGLSEQGEIVPNSLDVLDYKKCRIGVEDDEENAGKIIYKDYEGNKLGSKDSSIKFNPFNKNQSVLLSQISREADDLEQGIKKFKGQVYFLNLSNYAYPLSPLDSALMDADTEYRIATYTNGNTRNGFLGKTVAITQGLDKEQEEQVENDMVQFLGAEDSSSIYYLNVENAEDLDKVIKFEQLKPQFDDKLFELTDKRIRRNILSACNNLPEPLVNASEGSLFGTSGDTYAEMKEFYSEQTAYERGKLESTLNYLGFPCKIKPFVTEKEINDELQ